jgi:eukaryotic-like serine/threonine-protein kinase
MRGGTDNLGRVGPIAPGSVIAGRYLVDRIIGSGGVGVVARATHIQLQTRVAVKLLLDDALLYPSVLARFAREARTAARMRGEHIARTLDVGELESGAPYVVMEYLEGCDLSEYLRRRGPLSVERAIRYVLQACTAIAEAHAANIVHRDIKPANLFLAKRPDRSRIIKVLDFGVAKVQDEIEPSLTKRSELLGTALYMSPEQLRSSKSVDHRTDIWSLGVTLYELLTRRSPFHAGNFLDIMSAIHRNAPASLRNLRPDVPEGLDDVVLRCMRSRPEDRYASVGDLAVALKPFANARDRANADAAVRLLRTSLAPPSSGGARSSPRDESDLPRVATRLEADRSFVDTLKSTPAETLLTSASSPDAGNGGQDHLGFEVATVLDTKVQKRWPVLVPLAIAAIAFVAGYAAFEGLRGGAAAGRVVIAASATLPPPPAPASEVLLRVASANGARVVMDDEPPQPSPFVAPQSSAPAAPRVPASAAPPAPVHSAVQKDTSRPTPQAEVPPSKTAAIAPPPPNDAPERPPGRLNADPTDPWGQ